MRDFDADSPPEPATLALVILAAAIASGREAAVTGAIEGARSASVPAEWVDELMLQSVLMVGWPRALSAAALWRTRSGHPAPPEDPDTNYARAPEWARRGEATCRTVYGANYDRLRANVRALHPALDAWMVVEGYGRTLSRPNLDLRRRELCTVAQCAVLEADRQLHSHLRGARHAGAGKSEVDAALAAARPYLSPTVMAAYETLWHEVRG